LPVPKIVDQLPDRFPHLHLESLKETAVGGQHVQAGIQYQQGFTDGPHDIFEVFSLGGILFFKRIVHATSPF
jgi:hypothetical protein